jgi:hypothetical protein
MVEIPAEGFSVVIQSLTWMESVFHRDVQSGQTIGVNEELKNRLQRQMELLEKFAGGLGLVVPKVWARDFIDYLENTDSQKLGSSEMQQWFEKILSAMDAELKGKLLMYIPSEKLPYYTQKELFGNMVETKIPSVSSDIAEAGRCIALGRYTATVFHLMRVMEAGVRSLANELSATFNPKDPWGKILGAVDDAIKTLPAATSQEKDYQSACRQVSASLHAVKDAWRNPTMHDIERSYTEEEAQEIWGCVKAFMRRLIAVLP